MTNGEPILGQLHPLNDCVLVELKQSTKNVKTKEGKYDTRTEGVVVGLPDPKVVNMYEGQPNFSQPLDFLLNRHIFFEEFKEGARIKRDGKIYSFIKIEDIRGYEDV